MAAINLATFLTSNTASTGSGQVLASTSKGPIWTTATNTTLNWSSSTVAYPSVQYYDGTGQQLSLSYDAILKKTMLFENEMLAITEDGKVYIDGKIEMNPTKIGKTLLKALEKFQNKNNETCEEFFY